MRMSQSFSQTLREVPAEAETASHRLMLRAGFMRQLGTGIYSLMPLAFRALKKIENIIREEIDAIGGQEMLMPVVHPADLWKETGRWYGIGSELTRFHDKNKHDMVLAMTHEEVVTDLTRREVQSYRHLPRLVYHFQTKWRDDPRPRAGLIRVREFIMKDSYSLDADWDGLDKQYRAHYQAYFNIFHRCGLPVIAVKSDVGMMGGKLAHEFMFLSPIGEDTLILCDECRYSANRQTAVFRKPAAEPEAPRPLEKVPTPQMKTIEALAEYLRIPTSRTAKAVFVTATVVNDAGEDEDRLVFAIVRGDMSLNETKLTNALNAKELRPATEEEIRAVGAVPGYASPVGIDGITVVVDDLIPDAPNLVAGANEEGYHLLNVNYGRDYTAAIVTDIAAADDGDPCPRCGNPLRSVRGVEVGNIFKLGTRYSDSMGATFLTPEGKAEPVIMGSYGIGLGRLLGCIAESFNDEAGLLWPVSVAPYHVHLVSLPDKTGAAQAEADRLYNALQAIGLEVLYDDRDERAGVKFNDADLIGLPLRITISSRALEAGGAEFKRRNDDARTTVPLADAARAAKDYIVELEEALMRKVVPVTYED